MKTFMFDFGGVLCEIDILRTVSAFTLFTDDKQKIIQAASAESPDAKLFADYEKGLFSTEDFRLKARKLFKLDCTDQEFDNAWNATIIGLFPDSLDLVKAFGKSRRVILLSNTNPLHANYFMSKYPDLFRLFDKLYFSHELKSAKPDKEIFTAVMNTEKTLPENIMFFDDLPRNIESAKLFGFDAKLVIPGKLSDFLHTV